VTTVLVAVAHPDDETFGCGSLLMHAADGLPDDAQRAWLGREHLIRLNPPWTGGPGERDLLGL
jgi:hypothetical protein